MIIYAQSSQTEPSYTLFRYNKHLSFCYCLYPYTLMKQQQQQTLLVCFVFQLSERWDS